MLELYHFKNSICSERVRMVLSEKAIDDWVDHHIDLFKGEQFAPGYLKLNPKAQTPTLVHHGRVIRESSIICDYIDDAFPAPPLKPADPIARAQMREWIKASDDMLYEAVAALSFASVFAQTLNARGPEAKEAHFRSQTDLGRVMRQRSCVDEGFRSSYVVRGVYNMTNLLSDLDRHLADGREWIMGDTFGLAEINYTPFLARIEALAMLDPMLEENRFCAGWWARCKARDSVVAAQVGPAAGEDADRYRMCGTAVLGELTALLQRLETGSIYDLASNSPGA